jgi:hypothetical protein
MELAYGIDEVFDWNRQKRVLEACLRNVKIPLVEAPPELKLAPSSQPGEFEGHIDRAYFASHEFADTCGGIGGPAHPERIPVNMKRYIQYEIQKANIHASQLGARSYIVEKFWNLLDFRERMKDREATGSPGDMSSNLDKMLRDAGSSGVPYDITEAQMSTERETIVSDLLRVLSSISQINMEPNGGSFVGLLSLTPLHVFLEFHLFDKQQERSRSNTRSLGTQIHKIRQITSMLLDTPRNRKGPLAIKAEEYLATFLDVLAKLERVTPMRSDSDGAAGNGLSGAFMPSEHRIGVGYGPEEEQEAEGSRNWADLREFQTKFALAGDFFNDP